MTNLYDMFIKVVVNEIVIEKFIEATALSLFLFASPSEGL